jgi:hypothetical protein
VPKLTIFELLLTLLQSAFSPLNGSREYTSREGCSQRRVLYKMRENIHTKRCISLNVKAQEIWKKQGKMIPPDVYDSSSKSNPKIRKWLKCQIKIDKFNFKMISDHKEEKNKQMNEGKIEFNI